jgi:7,8-dihydropterin-6-yl-methyl-4-(beta-D-ribofuranosyl)aminobenzene 5'-phosphate synthase
VLLAAGLTGAAIAASPEGTGGDTILNLYDAFGPEHPGLTQDFGFSALVRYRGRTILFDSGTHAAILKRNVEALGVDLSEVDFAVASHSHFDHISGFDHLLEVNPRVKIYFPADPFWGAPLPFDATGKEPEARDRLPQELRYFGGKRTKFTFRSSGRFHRANVEFVGEGRELEPGIRLVATRSPYMGYFSRYPGPPALEGVSGGGEGDEIKTLGLPELSLSLATDEGQVLVVGCSHSRVDVITEEARKVAGDEVALVYGGYHLLPYGREALSAIVHRMKDELGVRAVAPNHCTGHLGFELFREAFGERYHLAGLGTRVKIPR